MPYPRPSLPDLRTQARADLARLPGADAPLRRAVLPVFGDMVAALAHGEYGYLDWQWRQLFVETCDGAWLDKLGARILMPREADAPSAGSAVFGGVPNTAIPAGAVLVSPDGLWKFAVQAAGAIGAGGTASLPVRATTGGAAANLAAGTPLTLLIGIAGVLGTATVDTAGLTGGLDVESDDAYRARILQRMQNTPQGGAWFDYVRWAKGVAGVTRVWVYPRNRGAGTVDIAFAMDGRANIIPLAADIAAVQAAIDASRNVTADAEVFALTPDTIPVTLHNLVPASGYTGATALASAQAALAALFATTTPAASYGDGIPAGGTGGALLLEKISAAIDAAPGVAGFDLAAPTADIASAAGHIAVLGAVTAV